MQNANTPIEDIINLMTPDEILTTNANWLCQQYQRNGYILSKTTRKKIHKALEVARKAVLRAKSTKITSASQPVASTQPKVEEQPQAEEKSPYLFFVDYIGTLSPEEVHEVELNDLASNLTKQGYDFEDHQMLHKLREALAAVQAKTPKPVVQQIVEEKQMSIENRVRKIYLDMGPESTDVFTLDELLTQLKAEGYPVETKSVVERVIATIRACRPDSMSSNRNQREFMQTRQQRVNSILETMSIEELQAFDLMDTKHSSWQNLHRQLRFEGWRLTLKAQYEIIDLVKNRISHLQLNPDKGIVDTVQPVRELEPSCKEEAMPATQMPQKETPVEEKLTNKLDFSQIVEQAFVLCNGDIDLLEEKINVEIAILRRFCSLLKKF